MGKNGVILMPKGGRGGLIPGEGTTGKKTSERRKLSKKKRLHREKTSDLYKEKMEGKKHEKPVNA